MGLLMANLYKDILAELYNRIDTSKKSIDIGIKRVALGSRELVQSLVDTPAVAIELTGIRESLNVHAGNKRVKSADLEVILNCLYPVFDEKINNMYYNEIKGEGLIYFIEHLLDTIHKNTSGTQDPLFLDGDSIGRLKQAIKATVGAIIKNGQWYEFEIRLDLTTKNFTFSGRQT
jgi:hypothetical protein